jgi:putative oxidoreductase
MRKLESTLTAATPQIVSLFRIVFGLLFTVHGTQKLFAWPVAAASGAAVPMGSWPYWYAGVIELVVGVLLIVGLVTRLAAFVGAGQMAVAYFTQHHPKTLWPIDNGGEPAVLFCFGFLLLVFTGGGAFALDAMRERR